MKAFVSIVAVILVVLGSFYFWNKQAQSPVYEETQDYTANDRIQISFPKPGDKITSPLVVTGKARGNWFFEASFPLVLVNWDGLIIAEGYAEAQQGWMTTDYVPFRGELIFTKPEGEGQPFDRGAVIFKKDNPSGLPEHDAAVEIPVKFK